MAKKTVPAQLSLPRLYRGFVRSYAALNVPIVGDYRNLPLYTHQVISSWSNLGTALGFDCWCEYERHDLDWWENEDLVMHLESENSPRRLEKTIDKLADSKQATYKVGLVFAGKNVDVVRLLRQKVKKLDNTLLVTTWWKQSEKHLDRQGENFVVTGHHVTSGRIDRLEEARLVWPKHGPLHMMFPGKPNW